MTGLVLKLSPGERLLVNGAVVENGPRRAQIRILSSEARILRLRDALHPDEARTPVRRACLIAQMALSGDMEPEPAREALRRHIAALSECFPRPAHRRSLEAATEAVEEGGFYAALRALRVLIDPEADLLAAAR